MQLTLAEIKDLAEAAGFTVGPPDFDYFEDETFTIAECPPQGTADDDGKPRHYAHIAWMTDYPDEGCFPLGEEQPAPVLPNAQAQPKPRRHGAD